MGRVALINRGAALQAQPGLDLTDDLAAGGFGFEQLPDEAFEGQAQAEDAVAAVGAVLLGREQRCGQKIAQVLLELGQGGLAEALGGAAAQAARRGGEAGKQGVCIERYIYRLIDTSATLFSMKNHTTRWETQYTRLRDRFKDLGWISEGYVQDRGPGAGG